MIKNGSKLKVITQILPFCLLFSHAGHILWPFKLDMKRKLRKSGIGYHMHDMTSASCKCSKFPCISMIVWECPMYVLINNQDQCFAGLHSPSQGLSLDYACTLLDIASFPSIGQWPLTLPPLASCHLLEFYQTHPGKRILLVPPDVLQNFGGKDLFTS